MKSQKCSQCGLVNFADAFVCKRCNNQLQNYPQGTTQNYYQHEQSGVPNSSYSYQSPNQNSYQSPYQNQPAQGSNSSPYVRKMVVGALWAIGGTIATVFSYSAAGGGGRYFIFWGAILFGAVDFLIGLNGWISNKD